MKTGVKEEIHINYYRDILTKQRFEFYRAAKVHKNKKHKTRQRIKQEFKKQLKEEGYESYS